jgi:ProP effector
MTQEPEAPAIVTATAEQLIVDEKQNRTQQSKAIISRLAKLYPKTFFVHPKERKPLKIGIYNQVVDEVLPTLADISKKQLKAAFTFYCGHFHYVNAMLNETHRIDLKGEPVEAITPEQKAMSEQRLKAYNLNQSEPNMAQREILITTKNKLNLKPTKTTIQVAGKDEPVKASAKTAKITLVLDTNSITRVSSEGKKQVTLVVKVGEMKFTGLLNSKSYRKAITSMDELGADNCNAILQGSMVKLGELEGIGLVVQPRKAKEPETV